MDFWSWLIGVCMGIALTGLAWCYRVRRREVERDRNVCYEKAREQKALTAIEANSLYGAAMQAFESYDNTRDRELMSPDIPKQIWVRAVLFNINVHGPEWTYKWRCPSCMSFRLLKAEPPLFWQTTRVDGCRRCGTKVNVELPGPGFRKDGR